LASLFGQCGQPFAVGFDVDIRDGDSSARNIRTEELCERSLEETEGEFAAQMNTLPKFVASSSLSEHLPWNGTLLEADVSAEVAKLNEQTGKPSRMRPPRERCASGIRAR
jgi:hypothetical protein